MIAKRFQSFQRLAAGTAAVMGLYMITSQVASERTDLERVDRKILSARKDIRQLQTELGTRASLRQLERWNGEVLALTTPDADQFIASERTLATLDRSGIVPGPRYAPAAVVMAMTSMPAAPAQQPVASDAVEARPAVAERRVLVEEARKPVVVLAAVTRITPIRASAGPAPATQAVAKPAPKKDRPAAKKPIDSIEAKLLDDGLVGELASRARVESGVRRR
jgi:hypothetical protein